jgi:hypothetical protein
LVVTFVAGQRLEKRRFPQRLFGLAFLMAMPTGALGAGAAVTLDRPAPGMTFPSLHNSADLAFEAQVFDPAAAEFNSLLSYGAMSLIAPTIFGDFQSPTEVSLPSISGSSGFMRANSGLDPVTATAVYTAVQPDLMVNVTALLADAVGIGASSQLAAITGGAPASTPNDGGVSVDGSTVALDPNAGLSGLESNCGTELQQSLQAGSEFWNSQEGGAPVQFPRGVFVRGDGGDPLDLGPSGDPTNLPRRPVAHSNWCSPFATPFSLSGPLESVVVWILFSIVLAALLVAWLSRGYRLPAA